MLRPAVEFEGLRETRKLLRQAGDKESLAAVKEAHRKAAEMVVARALPHVPVRTGRLAGTVKALASATSGRAKAGTVSVPYARPIHWGWPRRNIKPRPFLWDALQDVESQIDDVFVDALHRNLEIVRASRS